MAAEIKSVATETNLPHNSTLISPQKIIRK